MPHDAMASDRYGALRSCRWTDKILITHRMARAANVFRWPTVSVVHFNFNRLHVSLSLAGARVLEFIFFV